MARFLVTGGCGFIGRSLSLALVSAGHRVRILDNLAYGRLFFEPGEIDLVEGSVGDPAVLERAFRDIDRCIHLAGSPILQTPRADRADHAEQLFEASRLIFDVAAANDASVVYASSAAVYGEVKESPIAETAACNPVNAHGVEKVALERAAGNAEKEHGLASIGLRMFNVYGAGQSPASPYCGVVRLFTERLLRGECVSVAGNGGQQRDFVYVDDAVRAIIAAAEAGLHGADVVNICTGVPVTVANVLEQLERATGRKFDVHFDESRDAGVKISVGLPDKAREILGFQTSVGFSEGASRMMAELSAPA